LVTCAKLGGDSSPELTCKHAWKFSCLLIGLSLLSELSCNVVHDHHPKCSVVSSDRRSRLSLCLHNTLKYRSYPCIQKVQNLIVDFKWVISSLFNIRNENSLSFYQKSWYSPFKVMVDLIRIACEHLSLWIIGVHKDNMFLPILSLPYHALH
jgi:hypothetical protein